MGDQDQDSLLPIAIVGRIMKQALPPNAKISKESKQRMQDCATEFISFVTGEASHRCEKENRKTVNGNDICWALTALGFDQYSDAIFRYLQRYREHERGKYCTPSKIKNTIVNSQQQQQQQEKEITDQNRVFCQKHHPDTVADHVPTLQFMIIEKGMSSSSSPKTT